MTSKTNYSKFILFNFSILAFLRIFELIFIIFNSGNQIGLVQGEFLGLFYDLSFSGSIFLIFYPFYSFISRKIGEKSIYFFVFISALLSLLHLLILSYFLYQLQPLDSFLYKYSLKDILFTINTSGLNIKFILISIFVFFLLQFFIFQLFKKWNLKENFLNKLFKLNFLAPLIFLIFFIFDSDSIYLSNKSLFFAEKSLEYYLSKSQKKQELKQSDLQEFSQLFLSNSQNNSEFPLLKNVNEENQLATYFEKCDQEPNVVFLIVEGLNDDFLHNKEVNLMPFLSHLKDSSLYWGKCFTLGERSFAAVPSLMGSLPYGEIGFTLQENFPQHLSLVSILKSNNYHTTFFYGQPGWFHNKYNFFKYNFCDEVYDNSTFAKKYKKIIVGKEKYFWGYDDKSLFSNAHEIIAKQTYKKRFDVYFTGSMHSPFIASEDKIYEKNFLAKVEKIKNESNKSHYIHHKRFYKSIPFTDDAFKEFFAKYKKRSDFENTIFVITGDHPMTEIPPKNLLKRFHVPLIIYSPKLKKSKTFSNVVSHLDVYESFLPFLKEYGLKTPEISCALGGNLFTPIKKGIVFMNGNRELIDYYSNGYYINDKDLYHVKNNFELEKIEDKNRYNTMLHELNLFRKTNDYVCKKNKIIPEELYYQSLGLKILKSQKLKLNSKEEYLNVLKREKIENKSTQFDFSIEYSCPKNSDISLVYTLVDEKDSVLLWNSIFLKPTLNQLQKRIQLEQFVDKKNKIIEGNLFLKVFIWNKSKTQLKLKKLKFTLFEN
jgi:uncharacterized sulfatase